MLDYWLKSGANGPVTLQVLDARGKLVRQFSSADPLPQVDEKELNVPTYWIRHDRLPSTASGMHRFVWDLRYPPPQSLEHDYPISAIYQDTPRYPLGASVLPGDYSVVLKVNGKTYPQKLTVKMDPRVKTGADGLKQQFVGTEALT